MHPTNSSEGTVAAVEVKELSSTITGCMDSCVQERTREAIKGLFQQRYHGRHLTLTTTRMALMASEGNIPFVGFLNPDNLASGVYGGMSLIWFPIEKDTDGEAGSLLTMVCGTRGLAPDEQILGRPGHARYLAALARYVRATPGIPVWVKRDPTNLSKPMPEAIVRQYLRFEAVFKRYGPYQYAVTQWRSLTDSLMETAGRN